MREKTVSYVIRLGLTLLVITAVVAGLLGAVNYITKDKIEALTLEKTNAAMAEVLPANGYDEISVPDGYADLVTGLWSAGEAGYVAECVVSGSQGDIDLMVGVTPEGRVSGVSIVSMSETSGLGDNAKKEEWRAQFVGLGQVRVDKDGGEIESLTGATVTSRAVCKAVSAAVACVEEVQS